MFLIRLNVIDNVEVEVVCVGLDCIVLHRKQFRGALCQTANAEEVQ